MNNKVNHESLILSKYSQIMTEIFIKTCKYKLFAVKIFYNLYVCYLTHG